MASRLSARTAKTLASSPRTKLGWIVIRCASPSRSLGCAHETKHSLCTLQEAYFPSINCNRWLAIRLEVSGLGPGSARQNTLAHRDPHVCSLSALA